MMMKNRAAMRQLTKLAMVIGIAIGNAYADAYSDVSQMARSGRFAEALARAEQFLATHPKDAQMRFIKGVVQSESGRASEAITTFTRLSEEFPELPEPHNNLAVLYAAQSQYDKARNALEMAIRTNPSYSAAHENLGDVYAKLASQAYNKALQLNPANPVTGPKLALVRELFSTQQSKSARAAVQTMNFAAAANAATATSQAAASAPVPNPVAKASSAPASSPAVAASSPPNKAPLPVAAASKPSASTAPAVAIPSSSPAGAHTVAASASDNKEVEAAVQAWASAWSGKDMKAYLGAYDKSFTPPGGLSRATWETERRDRITGKASISVKISGLEIKVSGSKATARFRQDYKAGELNSSTRKTLELQKSGDRWKITREAVGA